MTTFVDESETLMPKGSSTVPPTLHFSVGEAEDGEDKEEKAGGGGEEIKEDNVVLVVNGWSSLVEEDENEDDDEDEKLGLGLGLRLRLSIEAVVY